MLRRHVQLVGYSEVRQFPIMLTGKSNRGLAHSIFNLTSRGPNRPDFLGGGFTSASAKVKILCNSGVFEAVPSLECNCVLQSWSYLSVLRPVRPLQANAGDRTLRGSSGESG